MKNIVTVVLLCFIFSSCEKKEGSRTYTEVSVESEQAANHSPDMMTNPHAGMNMESLPSMEAAMPAEMGSSDPHAGFTKEQLAQMLMDSQGGQPQNNSPLSWTLPPQWEEKASTGMRVATFVLKNDPAAIDCSIVTLGPGAGGLSGNVIRWLGQLNMPAPSEDEINTFIKQQDIIPIKGDLSAQLINFTAMQKTAPAATPSMIAAIIDTPAQRIFIKMTGTKDNVTKQQEAFKSLIRSLEIR
jgi:hypothetical protein